MFYDQMIVFFESLLLIGQNPLLPNNCLRRFFFFNAHRWLETAAGAFLSATVQPNKLPRSTQY